MRYCTVLCAALLLSATTQAGEIKGDRKYQPYRMVRLESDVKPSTDKEGKPTTRYSWVIDGTGKDGKPVEADAEKYDHKLRFTGPPGTYKVRLTVVDFESRTFDEANCVVTIEGDGPSPGPDPGPSPDPAPDDAFTKSIKNAWQKDSQTSGSKEQMEFLSGVYTGSANLIDACSTVGDLYNKLSSTIHIDKLGIPKGALPEVSKAIGAKLGADLGTAPNATLDKAKAKATLQAVGAALRKALGKGGK